MHGKIRRVVFSLWVVCGISSSLFAVSAHRDPNEDYRAAMFRNLPPEPETWASGGTAVSSSALLKDLDLSALPVIKDADEMFEFVRDSRYLFSRQRADFARRSSWLYPHDGCWVRASVTRQLAKKSGYGDMKKLFIFGNLSVKTPNATGGSVSWWYHVVPIFEDSHGDAMVVDPAIHPKGLMPLKDWVLTMVTKVEDAKVSVCSPATYGPFSQCDEQDEKADGSAPQDQGMYLDLEWNNLLSLQRNPEEQLGDHPPWSAAPVF